MNPNVAGGTAELVVALAQGPSARAARADLAEPLPRPLEVVTRALRVAEPRRLIRSTIARSVQRGRDRDRVISFPADTAILVLARAKPGTLRRSPDEALHR